MANADIGPPKHPKCGRCERTHPPERKCFPCPRCGHVHPKRVSHQMCHLCGSVHPQAKDCSVCTICGSAHTRWEDCIPCGRCVDLHDTRAPCQDELRKAAEKSAQNGSASGISVGVKPFHGVVPNKDQHEETGLGSNANLQDYKFAFVAPRGAGTSATVTGEGPSAGTSSEPYIVGAMPDPPQFDNTCTAPQDPNPQLSEGVNFANSSECDEAVNMMGSPSFVPILSPSPAASPPGTSFSPGPSFSPGQSPSFSPMQEDIDPQELAKLAQTLSESPLPYQDHQDTNTAQIHQDGSQVAGSFGAQVHQQGNSAGAVQEKPNKDPSKLARRASIASNKTIWEEDRPEYMQYAQNEGLGPRSENDSGFQAPLAANNEDEDDEKNCDAFKESVRAWEYPDESLELTTDFTNGHGNMSIPDDAAGTEAKSVAFDAEDVDMRDDGPAGLAEGREAPLVPLVSTSTLLGDRANSPTPTSSFWEPYGAAHAPRRSGRGHAPIQRQNRSRSPRHDRSRGGSYDRKRSNRDGVMNRRPRAPTHKTEPQAAVGNEVPATQPVSASAYHPGPVRETETTESQSLEEPVTGDLPAQPRIGSGTKEETPLVMIPSDAERDLVVRVKLSLSGKTVTTEIDPNQEAPDGTIPSELDHDSAARMKSSTAAEPGIQPVGAEQPNPKELKPKLLEIEQPEIEPQGREEGPSRSKEAEQSEFEPQEAEEPQPGPAKVEQPDIEPHGSDESRYRSKEVQQPDFDPQDTEQPDIQPPKTEKPQPRSKEVGQPQFEPQDNEEPQSERLDLDNSNLQPRLEQSKDEYSTEDKPETPTLVALVPENTASSRDIPVQNPLTYDAVDDADTADVQDREAASRQLTSINDEDSQDEHVAVDLPEKASPGSPLPKMIALPGEFPAEESSDKDAADAQDREGSPQNSTTIFDVDNLNERVAVDSGENIVRETTKPSSPAAVSTSDHKSPVAPTSAAKRKASEEIATTSSKHGAEASVRPIGKASPWDRTEGHQYKLRKGPISRNLSAAVSSHRAGLAKDDATDPKPLKRRRRPRSLDVGPESSVEHVATAQDQLEHSPLQPTMSTIDEQDQPTSPTTHKVSQVKSDESIVNRKTGNRSVNHKLETSSADQSKPLDNAIDHIPGTSSADQPRSPDNTVGRDQDTFNADQRSNRTTKRRNHQRRKLWRCPSTYCCALMLFSATMFIIVVSIVIGSMDEHEAARVSPSVNTSPGQDLLAAINDMGLVTSDEYQKREAEYRAELEAMQGVVASVRKELDLRIPVLAPETKMELPPTSAGKLQLAYKRHYTIASMALTLWLSPAAVSQLLSQNLRPFNLLLNKPEQSIEHQRQSIETMNELRRVHRDGEGTVEAFAFDLTYFPVYFDKQVAALLTAFEDIDKTYDQWSFLQRWSYRMSCESTPWRFNLCHEPAGKRRRDAMESVILGLHSYVSKTCKQCQSALAITSDMLETSKALMRTDLYLRAVPPAFMDLVTGLASDRVHLSNGSWMHTDDVAVLTLLAHRQILEATKAQLNEVCDFLDGLLHLFEAVLSQLKEDSQGVALGTNWNRLALQQAIQLPPTTKIKPLLTWQHQHADFERAMKHVWPPTEAPEFPVTTLPSAPSETSAETSETYTFEHIPSQWTEHSSTPVLDTFEPSSDMTEQSSTPLSIDLSSAEEVRQGTFSTSEQAWPDTRTLTIPMTARIDATMAITDAQIPGDTSGAERRITDNEHTDEHESVDRHLEEPSASTDTDEEEPLRVFAEGLWDDEIEDAVDDKQITVFATPGPTNRLQSEWQEDALEDEQFTARPAPTNRL